MPYFKGNTHCHSTNSDGEISPQEIARYYKSIDYDFVAITDHHTCTKTNEYNQQASFAPIAGTEIGSLRLAHTVGLWVGDECKVFEDDEFLEGCPIGNLYQTYIDEIKKVGGIPILCHPFWHWTFDYQAIKNVTGWNHFELCNASPDCNAFPVPGYAPAEQMWDKLLSSNRRVFGVASDDAHEYSGAYKPNKPFGGRGFIMLKADCLTDKSLRDSFEKGCFYSSTGTLLKDYTLDNNGFYISIEPTGYDEVCSFEVFGLNGKLLQHTHGTEVKYQFNGDEVYVRVRIATTLGQWLWTQPIFLDDLSNQMEWINK